MTETCSVYFILTHFSWSLC